MKKPVIEVKERNPFGESIDDSVMQNPSRTRTYVPGYSDKAVERERAIAEGEAPKALPARLHWVRAERSTGTPDNRRVADMKAKGYKVLLWDEAEKLGYKVSESAAHKGPGGEVVLGDTVLMMAPAPVAAAHYAANRQRIDNQFRELVQEPLERAAEEANQRMGYTGKGRTAFEFDEPQSQGKKK